AAAFYGLAPGEFPGRSEHALPGPGLASRSARRGAVAGPHDAASRAYDGGATAACVRCAGPPTATRRATRCVEACVRTATSLDSGTAAATRAHTSCSGMVGLHDCHSCLACPRTL